MLVREVAPGSYGSPVSGVDRLDRVGRADHPADLHVVVQKRDELGPGAFPEPSDRRIPVVPLLGELLKPISGCGLVGRGIDRLEISGDLGPVLSGRELERVADQVDDAGLHRRELPRGRDRLRQPLQPVTDDNADVFDTPVLDLGEHAKPVLGSFAGDCCTDR